ncbi:dTMP kinase [Defluviitalea raffinosedens]|uniref:Thymidylate kinase n=2 Tax=Defluviitalea raffinosedens TaxID=1450156 RepID=A0A7C8LAY7_9FIRM|nr:dTMP kinase [Defluviitalea raffinosedens]KAE9628767.1 dTMP kinase [Defluviitalea raffinosedens]HHW66102.1 dTMP kinase [Candidatus Epulonipiscium sp.]
MMRGLFISMEGSDGSGKTTQIERLKDYFLNKGYEVIITREPGGTLISEQIRNIVLDVKNEVLSDMTETLLYAASRAQHVEEKIKPALESGKIVISDRFVDSSIVYQGYARGIGMDIVEAINSYAVQGFMPDITFFFDIEPELAMKRKNSQKSLDRLEQEHISFHNKVYEGYKILLKKYPERIKSINARQSIDNIYEQIIKEVSSLLKEDAYETHICDHS